MRRLLVAFLVGLGPLLAGCGNSVVTLRNPESGIIVRCTSATDSDGQARCIKDFQSQGFEPVP
jgi:uncharacterized protein YceK